MKTIHGACFLACSKRSLTLDAPTPTNISTNSEPLTDRNGTFASPAIAFARRVLPVPGAPARRTPFGILPPSCWNFFGFLRKSTISETSSFTSSIPATSLKVTFGLLSINTFALLFAKERALLLPALICFIILSQRRIRKIIGSHETRTVIYQGLPSSGLT